MKKHYFFTVIVTILSIDAVVAQEEQTFTQIFDNMFANVSRTGATTGILYNRVVPFSGLYRFTATDTANAEIFMQAYQELYEAAFLPTAKLPYTPDALEAMVSAKKILLQ